MIKSKNANPMWGGHFEVAQSEVFQRINASIGFDKKLYKEDIAGSLAHVAMLGKQKILTKAEVQKIEKGLKKIEKEIEAGKFKFKEELEDIHMNIEFRLKEIIGDVAGKLHTGRSRNDQVATDFKLFVKSQNEQAIILLKKLIKELIAKAQNNINVVLPGYTHLQAAQPISFSHHLLCYVEMFGRDISRFEGALERLDYSPLGSAALAGTSFNIDRKQTAKALKFKAPTENSLDSVSDRDFALDFLSNTAITMSHISRFAEEIIIWMSQEFKFITLSDAYTTGSSIMPQKRNPDAAELIRGKTGRSFGNLISLLTTMKALPLAYSKDMQEDKEPVFDSCETLSASLQVLAGMVSDMKVNKENMLLSTKKGFLNATDLADYLVKKANIPFRKAHSITGKIVKLAEDQNITLEEVDLLQMQAIEPKISMDVFKELDIMASMESRNSYGGTASNQVNSAIKRAKKKYL